MNLADIDARVKATKQCHLLRRSSSSGLSSSEDSEGLRSLGAISPGKCSGSPSTTLAPSCEVAPSGVETTVGFEG